MAGGRSLLESPLPDQLEMLVLAECRLPSPDADPAVRKLSERMGDRLILEHSWDE